MKMKQESKVLKKITKVRKNKIGKGLINKIIDKLPFEMHVPGYQYCGPGTKLKKRLARGDPGKNKLDQACMMHDIAYESKNDTVRREADKMLAKEAWRRVKSKDASLGEKATALAVAGAMKAKIHIPKVVVGRGLKNQNTKPKQSMKSKKNVKLNNNKTSNIYKKAVRSASKQLKEINEPTNLETAAKIALKAAKMVVKRNKEQGASNEEPKQQRVIPVPKIGGVLPLIPIFAGLSALGSLVGGTSAVVNAVNNTKNAKKQLEENERHNKTMEAILLGNAKKGQGIYLKPYRKGLGLYIKKKKNKKTQKKNKKTKPSQTVSKNL